MKNIIRNLSLKNRVRAYAAFYLVTFVTAIAGLVLLLELLGSVFGTQLAFAIVFGTAGVYLAIDTAFMVARFRANREENEARRQKQQETV